MSKQSYAEKYLIRKMVQSNNNSATKRSSPRPKISERVNNSDANNNVIQFISLDSIGENNVRSSSPRVDDSNSRGYQNVNTNYNDNDNNNYSYEGYRESRAAYDYQEDEVSESGLTDSFDEDSQAREFHSSPVNKNPKNVNFSENINHCTNNFSFDIITWIE